MKRLTAKTIYEYLKDFDPDLQMEGDSDTEVRGISSVNHYKEGCLTWVKGQDKADLVKKKITAVVCTSDIAIGAQVKFITDNPKNIFFVAADYLSESEYIPAIAETAELGSQIKLGAEVSVGTGTCIGDGVQIGDGTIIEANVTIGDHVIIGAHCHIKAGAVIGGRGFGYSKNNGTYRPVRHFGSVVIGNNVDVGSNTCIDRGTLDDTIIHDGVKIDNLCHIAHNVVIEENTLVIANSTICGSVHIGKNAYIAPHSVIMNQLEVGDGAVIGMAAVVTKDVKAGTVNTGCPSKTVRMRREDEWVKY
ncbi:MAG: hypothetical protein HDR15_08415 [Lachnospiraceae bacterium]|nr:hypothetical protein [Lachnospiraceae bacterium]